jgi:hypothetical protein
LPAIAQLGPQMGFVLGGGANSAGVIHFSSSSQRPQRVSGC